MVNFLMANKSKLMQLCMDDNSKLNLDDFYTIFESIINKDVATAVSKSIRTTALLLDILDVNNIVN